MQPLKKTPSKKLRKKSRRKSLGSSPHTTLGRLRGRVEEDEDGPSLFAGEDGSGHAHPVFRRSKSNLRRRERRRQRQRSRENEAELLQAAMRAQLNSLRSGDFHGLPDHLLIFILDSQFLGAEDLVAMKMTCRFFERVEIKHDGRTFGMIEFVAKKKIGSFDNWSVPWPEETYTKLLRRATTSRVFVLGGWNRAIKNLDAVEAYDEVARVWRPAAAMSRKRRNFSAVTVNGKVFVFGGEDMDETLKSVECMDPMAPEHRQWTTVPPMLSPLCRMGSAKSNHHIYISGGLNAVLEPVRSVIRFNARKRRWKPFCEMQFPRYSHASVVLNNRLFILGGYDSENLCLNSVHSVRLKKWGEVKKLSFEWKYAKPMMACSGRVCAVVWRNKIVVADGMRHVEVYDPVEDSWSQMPLLQCRRRKYSMVAHDDRIFVIGGYDESGMCLRSVEMYNDKVDSWVYVSPLRTARDGLVAVS